MNPWCEWDECPAHARVRIYDESGSHEYTLCKDHTDRVGADYPDNALILETRETTLLQELIPPYTFIVVIAILVILLIWRYVL